jgi:hypothetical protein
MTAATMACDFCDKTERPLVESRDKACRICFRCVRSAAQMLGLDVRVPNDYQPLTKRQSQLYDYLQAFSARCGFMPSYEEIAKHLRLRSLGSVHELLHRLEQKGWVKIGFNRTRAVECLVNRSGPTPEEREKP